MRRPMLVALLLAACGSSGSNEAPRRADGTVTVDGQARTVTACAVGERGVDQTIDLTLDDGAVLGIAVHASTVTYRAKAGEPQPLECKGGAGTSLSTASGYADGTIGHKCAAAERSVEIDLALTCGDKPASNEKPKAKPKP